MLRSIVLLATLFLCLLWSGVTTAQDREQQARQLYQRLGESHWVAEGATSPERVVYTFTDMECPYCARQWQAMRPFIESPDNRTQVRHIIVAMLKPTSFGKGAAVLAAPDPTAALKTAQEDFRNGGITPMEDVPEATAEALRANSTLMRALGIRGTPATVFRDPKGQLQFAPGLLSEEALRRYVFQVH